MKKHNGFEFLLDGAKQTLFDKKLHTLLNAIEYTIITVCVDKLRLKERYNSNTKHPYHYASEMIMERFYWFLEQKRCDW